MKRGLVPESVLCSHVNALQMVQIDEDEEFLIAQWEPGRTGSMAGLDKKLEKKESGKMKREEQVKKRQITSEELKRKLLETVVLDGTFSFSAV